MLAEIMRRLLQMVIVIFTGLVFVFSLSHIVPSDPARAAMGQFAAEASVEKYRHEHGLDRPVHEQFVNYMSRLLKGDLGKSILTTRDVSEELFSTVPATVELVVPSLLLSSFLGIAFGVISAAYSGKSIDHSSRLISLFGMSMPVFWFGLALQLLFFRWLDLLPIGQRLSQGLSPPPQVTGLYTVDSLVVGNWPVFWDAVEHLVLPVFVLSLGPLAIISRIARTTMLEQLSSDYIRTARSKGLTHWKVLLKHGLPNTLIPIVTIIGLQFGSMLGGTVIVETIFSWPGIGRRAVQSLRALDFPVVMGFTLYMILVYSVVNLIVDLSYYIIDPRVKSGARGR